MRTDNNQISENNPASTSAETTIAPIKYPDPPENFDLSKYKDELERYDPANVADLMFNRKERKIPGSVLKPHSMYVNLVQTNAL